MVKLRDFFKSRALAPIVLKLKGKEPTSSWKDIKNIEEAIDIAFGNKKKNLIQLYKNDEKGLGILTGKISNVTVIDVDVKNNNYKKHLDKFRELDPDFDKTFKVFTGKYNGERGFHLYYIYTDRLKTCTSKEGIDIRNDGGYCKIIGKHLSGVDYEIADINADFRELNDEMINYLFYICKNEATNIDKNKEDDDLICEVDKCNIDKDTVIDLVNHLSIERSDNYDTWIKVGFLLKGLGEQYKEIWHEFSKKSNKYDEEKCDKFWNNFKEESKFTIASLIYWAKCDSNYTLQLEQDDEFINSDIFLPINLADNSFVFNDFIRDEIGFPIETKEQYNRFIKGLCQVVNFLQNRAKWAFKTRDEHNNIILKIFSETDMKNLTTSYKINIYSKKRSLWKIINSNKIHLTHYDTYFKPCNIRSDIDGFINTFTGIKAKLIKGITIEEAAEQCERLLNHIYLIWADNNEEYYNYIIGWLRKKIVNLEKNITSLIIVSEEQGVGKSLIGDFLCEKIIGTHYCSQTDDIERITAKFNSLIDDKILTIVNELSRYSNKNNKDKAKTMITDKERNIERKGLDVVKKRDYNSYIMFSNHFDCVQIDPSDRRYAIFKCGHKQDNKYYDELLESLNDDKVADYFYTYLFLYNNEYEERNIPNTEIRSMLMENSDKILTLIKEDKDIMDKMPLKTFYEIYKAYCIKNNYYVENISYIKTIFMGYYTKEGLIDINAYINKHKKKK